MSRFEKVELGVLCLVRFGNYYLLQDRLKDDWRGLTLPGGHVEKGESIVKAVIREMQEETGLTILNPHLCGIRQFPKEDGRYIVVLFTADKFKGEVRSSEEGQIYWVHKDDLERYNIVGDLIDLMDVMLSDELTEFQYDSHGQMIKN